MLRDMTVDAATCIHVSKNDTHNPHPSHLAARVGPVVVDELLRQVVGVVRVLLLELLHWREEHGAHLGHGDLLALFVVLKGGD